MKSVGELVYERLKEAQDSEIVISLSFLDVENLMNHISDLCSENYLHGYDDGSDDARDLMDDL